MTAYYNEIDPYAAQWLRNLIDAGHIAPGIVDERSIEDVRPVDLHGFTQCHFFAGIGVWSLALRRAGWADDHPIWTASCPCQPFSQAGEGDGFVLMSGICGPTSTTSSTSAALQSSLESRLRARTQTFGSTLYTLTWKPWGYAFGAVAFPSAGIGAPHIRDRTYWLANAAGQRLSAGPRVEGARHGARQPERPRLPIGLAHTECVVGRCEAEPADHIGAQAHGSADWGRQMWQCIWRAGRRRLFQTQCGSPPATSRH